MKLTNLLLFSILGALVALVFRRRETPTVATAVQPGTGVHSVYGPIPGMEAWRFSTAATNPSNGRIF
jgi:hypothetical protein